ncbi:hypothetical protein AAHC03_016886 [Spirometra sp. Aus1]
MDQHGAGKPAAHGDIGQSLLRAARAGDSKKISDLISLGANVNYTNPTGLTALHLAAKEGHALVVKQLLVNGSDVNAASKKGNTALHIASLAGHQDVVKALLDANANVNCQSLVGFTPLYMAAQENHLEVVNLLLNKGANQSLTTEDGFTPLAVALQQGHDRVVATLLERDTRSRGGLPALHVAARKDDVSAATLLLNNPDVNVDHQSQPGFTALHISAHYGTVNVGALLIQRGAEVNFQAKNNITPLHVAAKWGRLQMVKLLLDSGAIVDCRTRDGLTPLHCAARSGHNAVCNMLIDAGSNPSAKTRNGLTPLHMAAQGNHDEVARTLISRGASLEATTGDFLNPLHVAAHCGNVKVARLLLDNRIDMNARALNGFTPLHIACKKQKVAIVELLLSYGAQIACTTEAGLTPLHVAAFVGSADIVRMLLERGASVDQTTMRCETALHLAARNCQLNVAGALLSANATVDAKAKDDQTPLHLAVLTGSLEMVTLLLSAGADPNLTTRDAYTALHIAAKEGRLDIVQALLEAGADPDARTRRGFSPLHLAAKRGRAAVARQLLQVKSDNVNAEGRNGLTPLHMAVHYNHVQLVELLLDHGADASCARGFSPLHLAAKRGRAAVARQLLQVKSDNVNAEGRNGLTPLHMAVHYNHVQLVELLLDHGADASCAAGNGYTALHIAAKKNHQDIASLLLADDHDNHRSTNAESRSGFTPLHLASQEGNVDMVGLLLLNGAEPNHQAKNGLTPLHLAAQEDRVNVAQQLVSSGADISAVSHAGYTPLHTACHFGRLNMVRYLLSLADRVDVNRTTKMGFTPLHLAAQQGHSQIASLLLEHGADANLLNEQGLTAAHIARRRHFPVLFDTLRTVTTVVTQWEDIEEVEEVILDSPEFMGEGAAVDSDDEGIRSPVPRRANGHAGPDDSYRTPELYAQQIPDQQASASATDTVRVPVDNDQIWCEMEYLSQPLGPGYRHIIKESLSQTETAPDTSPDASLLQTTATNVQLSTPSPPLLSSAVDEPINETIRREEQSGVSMTLTTDGALSETSKVLGGPGDHLDAEWEMETEVSHMLKKPRLGGFLVSFLVDARGGILDCKRYPGLRFIIPPNASVGPLRIICRFLRYPHSQLLPPLNDGEGLACRMMEMGPIGVRFNAPLLIEIPYCASLKSQQREIIVLRSDNGETWKEHPFDATDQAVQDSLGEYFNDAVPSTDLRERRVHRILTNTIPQYFALITRIRQDLILIGPEGSVLTSAVVPAVQVCFPPGALQKKIRVGLQVQDIPSALVTKCLGPRIAVSPIVSIEPRRRKFHRPITITIPLPGTSGAQQSEAGDNGQANLSTIRLLCSITGGTSPAIWEDITGSSPFSMQQNCVSFTTTVSARLWLIDCPNLSEVTEMATTLYRESVSVPYFGQFLVYCRRHHPEEAQLRCVCLTDDTEQKTLECQEGFEILARGEPVEILHDHICWLESAGNLVPVAKSGEQLHFYLRAFEENRLNMLIRVKDAQLPHSGKLAFMPTQRTPGGTPVEPLTVLDVLLPRKLASTPRTGELERRAALEVSGYERSSDQIDGSLHPASSDEGYRCSASTSGMGKIVESIARSDLDVKRIAQSLGPDWPALAGELGLSRADCDSIAEENSTDIKRAYACLLLWQERSNKEAATGTVLGRALRRIGRDDILKQCMKNIELVQDENELSVAVRNLQHEDSELEMHEDSAAASPDAAKRPPPGSAETNDLTDTSPTDVETLISPVASSHGDMPPNRVGHATEEERRAAVEQLVAELDDDIPTPPSLDSGSEAGVEEAELVPHVKGAEPQKVEASQVVTTESGVPLSMLQEDEANEPSEVAVRIPLEATGNNPPVISNDDSLTTEKSEEPVTFAEPMVVSCKSAELSSLPSDAASPTSCTRHRSPANTQECHLSLTRPTGAFPYNQPIGGLELDDVFPPSAPLPGEFNVSCSTSATTTYRADLKTQQDRTVDSRAAQGASYISTASSGGPLISGEFVLVRQGFDDGPAPLVREKADFVVPIPLTRGAAAPSVGAPHPQQLVGPGTCKITAQLRKQALLDGHFRLCRSRSARGAGPRVRDAQDTEEDELPPEPPRRTTSLVAGRCSRDDMQVNYGGPNQPSGSPPLPFDAAPVTDLGVIPLWDGSHPREVDDLIKNLGWLATDRNIRE